jgi:hypothetical protein
MLRNTLCQVTDTIRLAKEFSLVTPHTEGLGKVVEEGQEAYRCLFCGRMSEQSLSDIRV